MSATRWTSSEAREPVDAGNLSIMACGFVVLFFCGLYLLYFSPALLNQSLLAPGDGEIYYLPFFNLPVNELWNDLILSGYPVALDIQAMTFYPLRWLSPSFNMLVISAYVVAAVGMFGFCLRLTGSRLGAVTAALITSGSGFMLGHLGHLSIIHAAAWVPWILWSLLTVRASAAKGIALGAIATALCIYGGHPQVSVIGLLFSGAYAVFLAVEESRRTSIAEGITYLCKCTMLFLAGLILAGPALVGLIDSGSNSVRSAWSIADFGSFSHDIHTLRMLWFPNLYGGQPTGPYGAYSGPFNLTELTLYAGIGSWILALAAVIGFRRNPSVWFWMIAIVFSLLLAMGTSTPLGELVYEIPVLGKFRAQARYGWVFILSVSILAAYGMAAVMSGALHRKAKLLVLAVGAATLLLVIVAVAVDFPSNVGMSTAEPWRHPAIWVPLVIMLLTMLVMAFWLWKPGHAASALLLIVLFLDLASFGWFHDWHYLPAGSAVQSGPRYAQPPSILTAGDGRLLTQGAQDWPAGTLRPNVNITAGVPLATGYGPLLSARYAQVTGADTTGGFPGTRSDAPLLDVLGIRWIAGVPEAGDSQLIGNGCGMASPRASVRYVVPESMRADRVRIISHMACSEDLANGYTAATLHVIDNNKVEHVALPVKVGEQTGEWAYDRKDLTGVIAHSRPAIAESFDAGGFRGHYYEGTWSIEPDSLSTIEVTAAPDAKVPLKILHVQIHDEITGTWKALAEEGEASPPEIARPIDWGGEIPLRERSGYRGMAWLACHTRQADLATTTALLSGKQGGERIDPFTTALTEKKLVLSGACNRKASAKVVERRNGFWRIRTQADGLGILVVSSAYHAGWMAELDGIPLEVRPVDGILLGLPVGSGEHEVVLKFRPPAFIGALGLSLATLLVLFAWLGWNWLRSRNSQEKSNERHSS